MKGKTNKSKRNGMNILLQGERRNKQIREIREKEKELRVRMSTYENERKGEENEIGLLARIRKRNVYLMHHTTVYLKMTSKDCTCLS